MAVTTCIFDAYGTLFDVNAAAREAATDPRFPMLAQIWPQLAEDWRLKQLEYTWLRAVMDRHCDFWQVTGDGLDWAMARQGLDDPQLRDHLMQLYRVLSAYDEVPAMLKGLKAGGRATGILSNGSPDMLAAAVASAGIGDDLDALLSVESVGVFKPSSKVYDLVQGHFGTDPSQVLFVSSNGWDAAAAADYGFVTAWVNRRGLPLDALPGQPRFILPDLSKIIDLDIF